MHDGYLVLLLVSLVIGRLVLGIDGKLDLCGYR